MASAECDSLAIAEKFPEMAEFEQKIRSRAQHKLLNLNRIIHATRSHARAFRLGRLRHQALPLVEPDRLDADARLPGGPADGQSCPHPVTSRPMWGPYRGTDSRGKMTRPRRWLHRGSHCLPGLPVSPRPGARCFRLDGKGRCRLHGPFDGGQQVPRSRGHPYSRTVRRRRALPITDTELRAMASAATSGLSRSPVNG